MSTLPAQEKLPAPALPAIAVLAVNARETALLTEDGEIQTLSAADIPMALHKRPVMLCHAPYIRSRLGDKVAFFPYDLLELFAFVHPGRFCVPTPVGLAKALGLAPPQSFEDYPFALLECAQALLSDLQREKPKEKGLDPAAVAQAMGLNGKGWPWAPFVCAARGVSYDPEAPVIMKTALNVWKYLPELTEDPPPAPPAHHGVTAEEAQERLVDLLGTKAEKRKEQLAYTANITTAFAPAEKEGAPHFIMAEAGTGVGKTLGYLAPASLWAEKNDGAVWVSTFTKNLQRQIDTELDRLYPDEMVKNRNVAIRKGRENYLCLLNLEDAVLAAALAKHTQQAVAAGLLARWAEATKDGDLQSGDLPGWLHGLFDWRYLGGLADRRGECVFSACDHFHKCFVERSIRKGKHARIAVANHALVMYQTAMARPDTLLPQRYVFDEGHHLFDAADSAFAAHLTGRETADLRRWLRGAEGGRSSRSRGLKRRAEDLVAGDHIAEKALESILHHAAALPGTGWTRRLKDRAPSGPAERFLLAVYEQVHARDNGRSGPYSLETETFPVIDGLAETAQALKTELREIVKPMEALSARLQKKLHEQADALDSDTRKQIESVAGAITWRTEDRLKAWIGILEALTHAPQIVDAAEQVFVDWIGIERADGQAVDVGVYRHWIDPIKPFAAILTPHAHGIAVTSATLRAGSGGEENDDQGSWESALRRTGAPHFTTDPQVFSVPSPFDYAAQTRLFIVNDVNKNDMDQLAATYRVLFEAAGGGALGLFTAIHRLKAVQSRITAPLEEKGFPLYAQHVDGLDTSTLVDMFRTETHACLLGTDAVRDGVDVPGESLRLLVYDRVPWPRPTILHKARRRAFGGRAYDEEITRLKLRQAFGRLIRRADDRGVFVMLDGALPSNLQNAFPVETPIVKAGLADTVRALRDFYAEK